MHNQAVATGGENRPRQRFDLARRPPVRADQRQAAFDGDRNRNRRFHRRHAFGDPRRAAHHASAESARARALAGAAAIQINLAKARAFARRRRPRQFGRVRARHLQRQRALGGRMGERFFDRPRRPARQRRRDRHLRVKQRRRTQQPPQHPPVSMRIAHHRRDRESSRIHLSSRICKTKRLPR